MTDLDIEIEIPGEDEPEAGPPVYSRQGSDPPWRRIGATIAVAAIALASYGYLQSDPQPEPAAESAPTTAPATAPPPPTEQPLAYEIEQTLAAVEAWERFANTHDPNVLHDAFDPEGPQAQLLQSMADSTPNPGWAMALRDPAVGPEDGYIAVSGTLLVTDPNGATASHAYDFVYLDSNPTVVWTVTDRANPQAAVLPPTPADIAAATQVWEAMLESLANERADLDLFVTDQTAALFDSSEELGSYLRGRSNLTGRLAGWTETGTDTITAVLATADGDVVASVPFRRIDDEWLLDLEGAINTGGTS